MLWKAGKQMQRNPSNCPHVRVTQERAAEEAPCLGSIEQRPSEHSLSVRMSLKKGGLCTIGITYRQQSGCRGKLCIRIEPGTRGRSGCLRMTGRIKRGVSRMYPLHGRLKLPETGEIVGAGWDDKRYCWLPYDYVFNQLTGDCWSLLCMEWVDTKQFGI